LSEAAASAVEAKAQWIDRILERFLTTGNGDDLPRVAVVS
jgi:hypothetical protein